MNDFKKETYSEKVANYIKVRILNGNLSPGDPIKETDIASQLSISRAPVREAMLILLREGLIEIHPQRGKKVTSLSAKQIKNSYFTGGVLEAAAVAQAIERYTDKDIAQLDGIISKMKQVADKNGSVSDQAPLDKAFHDLLFSRIDNELIVELCRRTCQGISKFLLYRQWVKLFPAIKVYERHKEIVDALKTKDPQVIEVVIRNHYVESGERMSVFGADMSKDEN
ncbi:GntR family transcriptional regulator [Desulfotignum phosphitoxidans]|jgi:DNA-binding GntR family transcriptional regulator|uniref:Transcriptional regulator, GntR family n=1 Tax=Desulfotignum phosphitoxidans DSM 13687 TaxID=1286635 RepID=S0FVW0_9BACT|nr:GntR family transcriptional regulator [Desulfotignum phosphitoxidans]EMS78870.1 transcriptional regulator, GntR family [Desulfotignum phosphitoxidans DSM 13687]